MISRSIPVWIAIFSALGCASPPSNLGFKSVPPSSMDGPDPNRRHPPLVTLEDFQRFDRLSIDIDKGKIGVF